MAALYEGYTLCAFVPQQNLSNSGIQGVEIERDSDHVLVTDSSRSVILYKVSDQKPLGSWTVKQGQSLTCSAVFNFQTSEYVAVSDNKVIRIWKEDDPLLDKAFKATVTSDIYRVLSIPSWEPVVLFQSGAVRLLDSLLSAPQQPIEDVLSQEESIRWSTCIAAEKQQQLVIFTTEQKGEHFLYLQGLNPNSLQRYRLEREEPGLSPLSFSACYRNRHIFLTYLYPNGRVYQSVTSVRAQGGDDGAQSLPVPRSLLLVLPVGEGLLEAASALVLDEAHVAVVGVPHPSAGAGRDFLCIWNTNFQTLQAGKEMAGRIYGQLWSFSNKLLIPHGKTLSVIPFECPKSSLASALGKLKQAKSKESISSTFVPSWNSILHGDKAQPLRTAETRSTTSPTIDQVLELIKTAPVEEVQEEVERFLSRSDIQGLQPSVGRIASTLVSRSLDDPAFYSSHTLTQLLNTQCLCHSVCPDLVLLALERKDYFLCQLCLQFFPDIPEAVTCVCLKAFISVSFMETVILKERGVVSLQNGFSPTSVEDFSDGMSGSKSRTEVDETTFNQPGLKCPVGSHKAALLNACKIQIKALISSLLTFIFVTFQLFLQYLHFLYVKCSQDHLLQVHGFRSPSLSQIMDWVCLLLDAHFTVLVMTPEAKGLLLSLHRFVKSQVKLVSELGKIEGSLQELDKMKTKRDIGQYSIEVIELL
uniref:Nucleolar protein 11 n=1 Tax=Gouania willdenowi TaxID=441366 RepID=A0A8C5D662_GOUWI